MFLEQRVDVGVYGGGGGNLRSRSKRVGQPLLKNLATTHAHHARARLSNGGSCAHTYSTLWCTLWLHRTLLIYHALKTCIWFVSM